MAVSLSGTARFLVRVGASEPRARQILRDVREAAEGGILGNEQLIDSEAAYSAMGEYNHAFWGWITSQSLEALMDLGRMMEDLHAGNCVAMAETLIAFTHQKGVRAKSAARILRRAGWYHISGVITCYSWRELIPESLMAAWLEFNFLPPESSAENIYGPPLTADDIGEVVDFVHTVPGGVEGAFFYAPMDSSSVLASMFLEHTEGEQASQ